MGTMHGEHSDSTARWLQRASQVRAPQPPGNLVGQVLLAFLALCLFGNSVRASVCDIYEGSPPASVQMSAEVTIDAPATIEDEGCLFCYGCAHCSGYCTQPIAPMYATVLLMSAAEVPSAHEAGRTPEAQHRPADLLRPPIAD
jgi:hypothetical protein